jgi:Predicted nucleotide-binding protein containing TIR -like domain
LLSEDQFVEKTKSYAFTHFSADVVQAAVDKFRTVGGEPDYVKLVAFGEGEVWSYDTIDEFLAHYRASGRRAELALIHSYPKPSSHLTLRSKVARQRHPDTDVEAWGWHAKVSVAAKDRPTIESLFAIFESHLVDSQEIPAPMVEEQPRPRVFIGHGHSPLWRALKDHLQDLHGYTVEAFETGARAGHAARDVLEELLDHASFAILVLTAEDETADGTLRPRQNVIHEAGLFQGKLGFRRAILLREEGCEEFSNVQGVQDIRFSPGNIKEVFGDVLATLRREFGSGGVNVRRERPSRP